MRNAQKEATAALVIAKPYIYDITTKIEWLLPSAESTN